MVMIYVRFPLYQRNVEDLLAERDYIQVVSIFWAYGF